MNYLLYYSDGFIKKFPLNKVETTIGWSNKNNLSIKEEFISNHHLKILQKNDFIIIKDLDSTNGTYVEGNKVKEAIIKLGESFSIGGKEFYFKQGTLDEFTAAEELIPIFNKIKEESKTFIKNRKTKYVKDIYKEILKQILKIGLKKDDFNNFLIDLKKYLSNLPELGHLLLVIKHKKQINILFSFNIKDEVIDHVNKIINDSTKIFSRNYLFQSISKGKEHFYSYPVKLKAKDAALIYIPQKSNKKEDTKIEEFLLILVKEISLLANLISENKSSIILNGKSESDNCDIITINDRMKELIQQTIKIAKSDIFVLVQGESGTGKELFARLIHNNSLRKKQKFIAISCAAIPENLLEAELFGYEKGAFTGAYTQKKGKLELASEGTLVLDEIGDMPFHLQSRLLRALQENGFYRLGGTESITVNLRLISLTNKNITELIRRGKFREDLYFRLVHHTVDVPPLRDRKNDISILINHFTWEFSKLIKKNINGYSLKALKALQEYYWPGNIRQLKNEINRLVNLTENDEMVDYDLISKEIRFNDNLLWQGNKLANSEISDPETRKIIELLEKNTWNKTRTAKELGMTYRGLHKKMKRLKIEKPAN